jgi:hypothetical protein
MRLRRLQRWERGLVAALVATGVACGILAYVWSAGEVTRALRHLPVEQRAGLYQRTMENLTTICDPAPGRSMRDFCRTEAEFALRFPECDDVCRAIARRQMSLPRP